ncbi:MAG: TIGR03084 family metal-binding protein [Ilumatobacteraceae bacterium]
MDTLCDDLAAEQDDLADLVAGVDLSTATPAAGWTVADQVSHLWFFDQRALLALTDPDEFAADAAVLLQAVVEGPDPSVVAGRTLAPADLLAGWQRDRERLVAHARTVDPRLRVPWYGPAMSARSFITARLMETWAHGQDVADGLGRRRRPTDRLRHVAHIGVGARRFSHVANGRQPDDTPILVELTGPDGETWSWGPPDADEHVRGPALDFCLVVTQRRHLDDVDLEIEGRAAQEWMSIAQSFAGPPGPGRRPGQFT